MTTVAPTVNDGEGTSSKDSAETPTTSATAATTTAAAAASTTAMTEQAPGSSSSQPSPSRTLQQTPTPTHHPPPSPLSGCYLLIVLPEPHCAQHKDLILSRLAKGFLSWDRDSCHVDLEKELQALVAQSPEGEEARNGERLIQYATENLVTEVLIFPQSNTLLQCMRNLLASFTKHRHIIHAGYTFGGNGSWILQDGTFSLADFLDAFSEHEVQRVLRAYESSVTVDVHCAGVGDWSTSRLAKESCIRSCKVRINPDDVLTAGMQAITSFTNYVGQYLVAQTLDQLMEPSDVVGNIRFSHPTLYVFPGGQGDAALFGINGFNMLVDGGFARKSCFWDFARHLDRLDAVLLTRINNSNIGGIASVLQKKKEMHVYPQIGHFFCNLVERRRSASPDGDKDIDPLILNLIDMGQEMVVNLRHINLRPHLCYRDSDPINLYHKVGHGTLDMYVLSPSKDSREVKDFMAKWNSSDAKLFSGSHKKDPVSMIFPIQNLVSICALLVWKPSSPQETITRILFPGSTPQHKIFEGLNRLKHLEFLKHPVCTAKKLSTSNFKVPLKDKFTISKPKSSLFERETKRLAEVKRDKKDKKDICDIKLAKDSVTEDSMSKVPTNKPIIPSPLIKSETKTKKIVENRKIELEAKEKHLSDKEPKSVKKNIKKIEKSNEINLKLPKTDTQEDIERASSVTDSKVLHQQLNQAESKKIIKATKSVKPESKVATKSTEIKAKSTGEKKDVMKPSPTTPKKSITGTIKSEVIRSTNKTATKTVSKVSSMPAKSAKEASNRKVVEQKKIELSAMNSVNKTPVKLKMGDRKPIANRVKSSSPGKRITLSPAKSTKSSSVSIKPDKDIVLRKKRDTFTDSSYISQPLGVKSEVISTERDVAKNPDNMSLDSIESKVLADLKEEREVVQEIEAVLQKADQTKESLQEEEPLEDIVVIERKVGDERSEDKTKNDIIMTELNETPSKIIRKESQELTEEDEYLIVEKEEIYIEDSIRSGDMDQKSHFDVNQSEKNQNDYVENLQKKELQQNEEKELAEEKKEEDFSSEKKEALEEEMQQFILVAAPVAQKTSEDKSIKKTSLEKLDVSSKLDIEHKDLIREKLVEYQDRISILESGATTTAPSLPEDDRNTLNETKEHVNEKHLIHEVVDSSKNIFKPEVKNIDIEQTSQMCIVRDIVKTSDEVADLPVHEEVDPNIYKDNADKVCKNMLESKIEIDAEKKMSTIGLPDEPAETSSLLLKQTVNEPKDDILKIDDQIVSKIKETADILEKESDSQNYLQAADINRISTIFNELESQIDFEEKQAKEKHVKDFVIPDDLIKEEKNPFTIEPSVETEDDNDLFGIVRDFKEAVRDVAEVLVSTAGIAIVKDQLRSKEDIVKRVENILKDDDFPIGSDLRDSEKALKRENESLECIIEDHFVREDKITTKDFTFPEKAINIPASVEHNVADKADIMRLCDEMMTCNERLVEKASCSTTLDDARTDVLESGLEKICRKNTIKQNIYEEIQECEVEDYETTEIQPKIIFKQSLAPGEAELVIVSPGSTPPTPTSTSKITGEEPTIDIVDEDFTKVTFAEESCTTIKDPTQVIDTSNISTIDEGLVVSQENKTINTLVTTRNEIESQNINIAKTPSPEDSLKESRIGTFVEKDSLRSGSSTSEKDSLELRAIDPVIFEEEIMTEESGKESKHCEIVESTDYFEIEPQKLNHSTENADVGRKISFEESSDNKNSFANVVVTDPQDTDVCLRINIDASHDESKSKTSHDLEMQMKISSVEKEINTFKSPSIDKDLSETEHFPTEIENVINFESPIYDENSGKYENQIDGLTSSRHTEDLAEHKITYEKQYVHDFIHTKKEEDNSNFSIPHQELIEKASSSYCLSGTVESDINDSTVNVDLKSSTVTEPIFFGNLEYSKEEIPEEKSNQPTSSTNDSSSSENISTKEVIDLRSCGEELEKNVFSSELSASEKTKSEFISVSNTDKDISWIQKESVINKNESRMLEPFESTSISMYTNESEILTENAASEAKLNIQTDFDENDLISTNIDGDIKLHETCNSSLNLDSKGAEAKPDTKNITERKVSFPSAECFLDETGKNYLKSDSSVQSTQILSLTQTLTSSLYEGEIHSTESTEALILNEEDIYNKEVLNEYQEIKEPVETNIITCSSPDLGSFSQYSFDRLEPHIDEEITVSEIKRLQTKDFIVDEYIEKGIQLNDLILENILIETQIPKYIILEIIKEIIEKKSVEKQSIADSSIFHESNDDIHQRFKSESKPLRKDEWDPLQYGMEDELNIEKSIDKSIPYTDYESPFHKAFVSGMTEIRTTHITTLLGEQEASKETDNKNVQETNATLLAEKTEHDRNTAVTDVANDDKNIANQDIVEVVTTTIETTYLHKTAEPEDLMKIITDDERSLTVQNLDVESDPSEQFLKSSDQEILTSSFEQHIGDYITESLVDSKKSLTDLCTQEKLDEFIDTSIEKVIKDDIMSAKISSEASLPSDVAFDDTKENPMPELSSSPLFRDGHKRSGSRTATPEGFRSGDVIRTIVTTTRTMSDDGEIITTTQEVTEATNDKGETILLAQKSDIKVDEKFPEDFMTDVKTMESHRMSTSSLDSTDNLNVSICDKKAAQMSATDEPLPSEFCGLRSSGVELVQEEFSNETLKIEQQRLSENLKKSCKKLIDEADLDFEKALDNVKDNEFPEDARHEDVVEDEMLHETDTSKDPLSGWGSPLGLPSPKAPRRFNLKSPVQPCSSADLSPDSLNFDVNNWGDPMKLPSPALSSNDLSNKPLPGTPKKESKTSNKNLSENIKSRTRSESPGKNERTSKELKNKTQPVYVDLTYVSHHGNSFYTALEFFKKVRARYYVFSGTEPSREVYDAFLAAKKTWEDKNLEVTMIPTYDTDTLGYWVADNEEALAANHIDLSPSASRCTINLQDHETSCSAYRLEF